MTGAGFARAEPAFVVPAALFSNCSHFAHAAQTRGAQGPGVDDDGRGAIMSVTDEDLNQLWKALRILGWGAVALILLAPAVAMRFTTEVNWTTSDFVFAGIMLIGGATVIEVVAWKVRNPVVRIGFALVIVAIVALVWIEGAVGIFN